MSGEKETVKMTTFSLKRKTEEEEERRLFLDEFVEARCSEGS